MIGHLTNLTRWEWFKLRRRRMLWILLAILLVFTQMFVWGNFFAYLSRHSAGRQISVGTGGPGEQSVVITVICNDLREGRLPELPPGTDPSIYERMRGMCERVEALRRPTRRASGDA